MRAKKFFLLIVGVALCFVASGEAASPIKEEAIRYRIRGYQLQHQGHVDEAAELYRQAIAADPNYAAPHNDLGVIFEDKGEWNGAEKEYREALKIDPTYVDAYSNLSILYEKMQEKEKMIEALQKRVSLGKLDDVGTQEARAKLESFGITVEVPQPAPPPGRVAKKAPRKKTPLKETPPPAKELPSEEKKTAEKVQEEKPPEREMDPLEESVFLRNEGLKQQRGGKLDEALHYYRLALKKNPNLATAYNDLGIVLEEKEFLESAETHYRKALAINPSYTQALYNLGILYEKMGRREDAVRTLEEFVAEEKGGEWVEEARAKLRRLKSEEKKVEKKEEASIWKKAEEVWKPEEEGRKEKEAEIFTRQTEGAELKQKYAEQEKLLSFFEGGKQAYLKEDYVSAEDFFERVLLLDPENSLGKSYLAKTRKAIKEAREKEEKEKARQLREAEEAKRRDEERVAREAREKEETEKRKLTEEKERIEREAKEKALAEQKKLEQERKQKEGETLYEEAKKLYREGEFEKSLLSFQKLLVLVPDHPYASRYVDRIHEKQKELEEEKKAKGAEEKSRQAAAQKAEEERKQKIAVNFAEGESLLKEGDFEGAASVFQTVLSLDPNHLEAKQLLKKSEEASQKRREQKQLAKTKKKEEHLKTVDAKDKKLAQAYYEEGMRVYREGELEKAVYAFEKALSLNKDHSKAKRELSFVKQKQAAEEARVWRSEQEKNYRKEYSQIESKRLYERAKAAYDAGNYEMAKKTLEYLLTLEPTHPFAQTDLEEVEERIREKRQREGLARTSLKKETEKVLFIPPKRIEEGETFARAQQGSEGTEGTGRPHMQRDILPLEEGGGISDAHPSMEKMALSYQEQAYALQRRNEIDEAITYYQKAMAIRPSPGAANGLGVLYEKKGWYVQAEDAYKRALALDPQYLAAHTNLALLYERLERGEESLKHWKIRAERGDPGDFWTQKAWTRLEGAQIKKSP